MATKTKRHMQLTPSGSTVTVKKFVSPREFIRLVKSNRVSSSKLVLPKLGSDGLGKFQVTYKK